MPVSPKYDKTLVISNNPPNKANPIIILLTTVIGMRYPIQNPFLESVTGPLKKVTVSFNSALGILTVLMSAS